jgi:hypothetical protein
MDLTIKNLQNHPAADSRCSNIKFGKQHEAGSLQEILIGASEHQNRAACIFSNNDDAGKAFMSLTVEFLKILIAL